MGNLVLKNYQSLEFILKQIRKTLLHGQVRKEGDEQLPCFLIYGNPGSGKSTGVEGMVYEARKETGINFGLSKAEGTYKEPSDFLGRSELIDGPDGMRITAYAKPDFLPMGREGGVVIIDEVTTIHQDVIGAFKEFITNRSIGKWKLPDNWVIVCMGNPADVTDGGEQCDVKELDAAFEGRGQVYYVKPDVKGFLKWFHKRFGDSDVYNFIVSDNTAVNFLGKRGTPRDFARLQTVLNMEEDLDKVEAAELRGIVASNIGVELSSAFCDFRILQMSVSAKDILCKDWAEVQPKLATLRDAKNERFDIEMGLCRGVPDHFFKLELSKIKMENLDAFCQHVGAERAVVIVETMNQQTLASDGTEHHLRKRMFKFIEHLKEKDSPVIEMVKDILAKMKRD